ncbi:MAG: N-acetylglucosamine-6-phosphate deacetylase [Planctomycetales bacterium]|nr:N-acetylglucosamine-6-phosphate deacetylase [Planctomycetales bacterium]
MNELACCQETIDLQVNGFAGVDFNDPSTAVELICASAELMREDGVLWALPTVITAAPEVMLACIDNIVSAVGQSAAASSVFRGLHIEGPFLPKEAGYIGAHPAEHASPSNLSLLAQLSDAAGPLLKVVTLAPEVDFDGALTRFCTSRGIRVSAGHTDATLDQLDRCIDQGLDMFTHLANGCPRLLDRHDNIIYRVLSRARQLRITLIADGFHVPDLLFRLFLQLIPRERIAVVSDAISAATLGPGVYPLGGRTVRVGQDRAARDASGEHFVGSAATMRDADRWLSVTIGLSLAERRRLLYENAAAWFPSLC